MKTVSIEQLVQLQDTLLVCATSRLSQALRERHGQACNQSGLSQWTTLDCRTIDQWLASLNEEMSLRTLSSHSSSACLVLSKAQEALIWEEVIHEDLGEDAQYLFDIGSMAETAAQAHSLTVTWKVACDPELVSDEARCFLSWRTSFLSKCEQSNWIDSSRLQEAIVSDFARCKASALKLPKCVVFAGFNRYNPIEKALTDILLARGIEVAEMSLAAPQSQCRAVSLPDTTSECLAAAIWVRDHLAARPHCRLAIVVPDLGGMRSLLQDTLEDILSPNLLRAGNAETPRSFNISLGLTLNRNPLVSTALLLLDFLVRPFAIAQSQFGMLLRNPYWSASHSEATDRASIEVDLRKGVGPKASLSRVSDFVNSWIEKSGRKLPLLECHLSAMQEIALALNERQLPSAWRKALLQTLNRSGWLHERGLSSHEYQAREAFMEELTKLGQLDPFLGPIDASQALSQLSRLCRDRIFQPQTEGAPAIQVLGLLEASGLVFDAVWVMGMVDSAWPPPARPNPLLSAQAQRRVDSPNASAAVQLTFAQSVHRDLMQSGSEIVLSWPRMDGTSEHSPSPLLKVLLPEDRQETPEIPHWISDGLRRPNVRLAPPMRDNFGPAVSGGERIRGGTWLLRAQAICPAWAFYQYRLGAGKLDEPVEGLDSRKRGTFLHDSLEHFWTAVQTSQALRAMSADQRRQHITLAVSHVLDAHDADPRQEPLKPRFRSLEGERLVRLIEGWLALELDREQPFSAIACERSVQVNIEGINVNMKIDRIDQLEDGRLLVIDYKTGATIDTKNWASERITEPQLPIYAAIAKSDEGPVTGVVFAKVLMKDPAWAGLAEHDKMLPKLTGLDSKAGRKLFAEADFPDWASVLAHWSKRIYAIAKEIKAGDAGVRFINEKDLQYCDVRPILRLSERQTQLHTAQNQSAGPGSLS